jgi:phosphotriesterase-related protein
MDVVTVKGSISPDELGITAAHEHMYIDIEKAWLLQSADPYKRTFIDKPVTIDILGMLHRNPLICRDNLRYRDDALALAEATDFKSLGGKTIVDATNKYMGRKPQGLRKISEITGLNVVASTGFYLEPAHPPYVATRPVDEIAAEMVEEITRGMDGTEIKAGIIGELGTSLRTTPNEKKVLEASARAHLETKVPVWIHTERPGREGMKLLDILQKNDVDLTKVVIGHCSDGLATPKGMDIGYQEGLADRGAYLAYDTFGHEEYTDEGWGSEPVVMARDSDLVNAIVQLVKDGYLSQILLSTDVCFKIHLKSYGGWGIGHILRNVVPMLKRSGLDQKQVEALLADNPRKLFS